MTMGNVGLLFHSNPSPMWIYRREDLHIFDLNTAAASLFGYEKAEAEHLSLDDLYPITEVSKLTEALQTDSRSFEQSAVLEYQNRNGAQLFLHISYNSFVWEECQCRIVVALDITKRVQTELKVKQTQEQLERANSRLNMISQTTQDAIYDWDLIGDLIHWDENLEQTFVKYSKNEEYSRQTWAEHVHPEDLDRVQGKICDVISSPDEHEWKCEYRFIKDDDTFAWVVDQGIVVRNCEGRPVQVVGALRNITKRINDQRELLEVNRKLRKAQKIGKMGYWTHDIVADKSLWSDELFDIWEVDPCTFAPNFERVIESVHPEDRHLFVKELEDAFPGDDFYDSEHRIITSRGKIKWIHERITLHRGEEGAPVFLEGIAQDITEKKVQELKLRESLREREVLLEEIHHRVKNNLAVISGLMELEMMNSDNTEVQQKLRDSQMRIHSIALTHELLYEQKNYSNIMFDENLRKLVSRNFSAFGREITVHYDLDAVKLSINQALPCSLLVNEIVTNIAKHAFTDWEDARVELELKDYKGNIFLRIKDNGIGLPDHIDIAAPNSLGLLLIHTLRHQFNAELQIRSGDGTEYLMHFKKNRGKGVGSLRAGIAVSAGP